MGNRHGLDEAREFGDVPLRTLIPWKDDVTFVKFGEKSCWMLVSTHQTHPSGSSGLNFNSMCTELGHEVAIG